MVVLSFVKVPPFDKFFTGFCLFFALMGGVNLRKCSCSFFGVFVFVFFALMDSFFCFGFVFSSDVSGGSAFASADVLRGGLLECAALPILSLESIRCCSLLLSFAALFSFFFACFLSSCLPFCDCLRASNVWGYLMFLCWFGGMGVSDLSLGKFRPL